MNDAAIAMAYALMGKEEPVRAGEAFLRGYHAAYPLAVEELEALHALILTRLAVSVTKCASAMKADFNAISTAFQRHFNGILTTF